MKKIVLTTIISLLVGFYSFSQKLSPYIKVADLSESIQEVEDRVLQALNNNEFIVLGSYSPSAKSTLKVISFTRKDLKDKTVQIVNRGALGAVFKIGLVQNEGKVTVSYTNPDYILRAYLMDNYVTFKPTFQKFSNDIKKALSSVGNDFLPFGGEIKADKLKKYHYKIGMPYFTDPVELNEFATFEEGLKIIEANLKARKWNTTMVYKLVYPDEKVAVFGVGLLDKDEGEPNFLHKIGEAHAAALPYEIILQGTEATMLHGRYRIALHWPDLTMGRFMKIMSAPGDIKDALKAICN